MGRRPLPPLDRRRLRQSRRLLLVSGLATVLAVVATGLAGLSGRAGALVLLLVAALGLVVTGVHALVVAVLDDVRDRGVDARRPLLALGLVVLAGVVMAMAAGAAGS